ncbi:MAG: hypothetical protein GWP08_09480 [Nitrospiraceae bacterium]|nr:hypothetical protein [Nitrospiraceae bacterium]
MSFATSYYAWGCAGFLLGALLAIPNLQRLRTPLSVTMAVCAVGIYGGLVGTRMLFLLAYDPGWFLEDWRQALVFWNGGLSWLGGPVLGGVMFFGAARLARRPAWESLGAVAPGLALAHVVARVGCLFQGCCYGMPTTVPWGIHSSLLQTRVHPTAVYSMIAESGTAVILQWLFRRHPATRRYLFPLYGVLLSSHRFVTEAFRGSEPGLPLIEGLRFYQLVCLILFAISVSSALFLWRSKVKGGPPG